ncbi:hypothetical protein BY458DRAFT_425841, partial [Sporodiniella umbellata]
KKALNAFVDENFCLIKQFAKQFDNAAESKKNLLTKFRKEYKKSFPESKRCPSTILDFETIWFQAQTDKSLEIEKNKLSVPLLQS